MKSKTKTNRLNWLIKFGILVLLLIVLTKQILWRPDLDLIYDDFLSSIEWSNFIFLICIILLVPINWLLETSKWKSFMDQFLSINFFQSFKSILAGITVAILTPNRIGEYGGRLLTIPAENNWHSIMATFIGSVAQNIVTLTCGLLSLFFLKEYISVLDGVDMTAVYISSAVFILAALYIFFHVDTLASLLKVLRLQKYFKRFRKHFQIIKRTRRKILLKMLFISFLRYGIYATQYYLATRFFGVEIGMLYSFACICTVLFIQSGLPLPPFLSIFARGEIALIIWGLFEINELTILGMTFLIWLINLAIPALIGSAVIFKSNILQSLGYD